MSYLYIYNIGPCYRWTHQIIVYLYVLYMYELMHSKFMKHFFIN